MPNLQEEVLKLDSSDAFNYAVLGATTIGHELCHAFDSSGAQYGLMEKAWNGGQFLTNGSE
ncbi:M13-type metalloendopeptidase [Treponema sp.]|uniref:M13-type metalloendopeptidase n=1 Tax=Treponema sp. TaxID=166 RepID=UPI00338E5C09